ncbi:universal stress protein [Arthrobacter sp. SRS-W-1-2016]
MDSEAAGPRQPRQGGLKRLLLGSTAHAVLAQLACPTIITRIRRVKNSK